MVDAGGVLVNGGGGLSAQVAVAGVEVQSADVVGAVSAAELHAAFGAGDSVQALHRLECNLLAWERKTRRWGSESNRKGLMRRLDLGPQTSDLER